MTFANASRKQFSKLVPIVLICFSSLVQAKEIALTFDDAPVSSSLHFDSNVRTDTLIRKLKELHVPQVIVFANPCNGTNTESTIAQLKKYKDSGHLIGNHTCTHPRFDNVGFESFSKNAQQADQLLASLFFRTEIF